MLIVINIKMFVNFHVTFHKIRAKYHKIFHSLCKYCCVKNEATQLRLHFWPVDSTTYREPLMPLITDVEKSKREGSSGMPVIPEKVQCVCKFENH